MTTVMYGAPGVPPWDWSKSVFYETAVPLATSKPADRLAAEAVAMVECAEALSDLSPESRQRVAEWLLREVERRSSARSDSVH